jgi:hypothetical protein
LITWFELGLVSRETMGSVLAAYNNSCAKREAKQETLISVA